VSKIALTPNASGTGTFTLAAPNSNTSRTITLPDEAGEVLVNGTNQNVGIGTSSPTTKLQSKGGSISTPTDNSGLIANASASFVVDHANDYGLYTGYVASANDAIGIAATRTLGSALPLSLQPFGGNVGIGTSSPSSPLTVSASASTVGQFITSGSSGYIEIDNSGGGGYIGTSGNNMLFLTSTSGTERMRIDSSGVVRIGGQTGTLKLGNDGTYHADIEWEYNNNELAFTANNTANFTFNSNGSERMRLDSSGNLLVGTTDSTYAGFSGQMIHAVTDADNYACLAANASRTAGNQAAIVCNVASTNSSLIAFDYQESRKGSITTNGSATSYNTTSDYRLKTDAQPMTGASARVQALKPVNFEWIANGTRVDGFLAHEAQAVVPEAVTGTKDAMRDEEYEVTPAVYEDVVIPAVLDEDGNELEAERTEQQLVTEAVMGTRSVPDYQGIDQSKLVPLLTAALQEALTEISDLKARVTALEAV
jgi:hypothetical protein